MDTRKKLRIDLSLITLLIILPATSAGLFEEDDIFDAFDIDKLSHSLTLTCKYDTGILYGGDIVNVSILAGSRFIDDYFMFEEGCVKRYNLITEDLQLAMKRSESKVWKTWDGYEDIVIIPIVDKTSSYLEIVIIGLCGLSFMLGAYFIIRKMWFGSLFLFTGIFAGLAQIIIILMR